MDLADFLLARIAEDEAVAREAAGVPWEVIHWPNGSQVLVASAAIRDEKWRVGHLGHVATVEHRHDVAHIARWDPARVLAECESKRRIVKETGWVTVMSLLAAPYASHPDYREEWKV